MKQRKQIPTVMECWISKLLKKYKLRFNRVSCELCILNPLAQIKDPEGVLENVILFYKAGVYCIYILSLNRPTRLPSDFALGQSLGPRGAKSPPLGNLLGLGGCIFRYIPPLGSVRIHHCSTDNVHCPWRTRRISCMPWVSRVEDEEFYDIRIYQADQRSVITSWM